MFTSTTISAYKLVLLDDTIERLGKEPTQEPVLAGLVDPNNKIDVLLALPPAHYMERIYNVATTTAIAAPYPCM